MCTTDSSHGWRQFLLRFLSNVPSGTCSALVASSRTAPWRARRPIGWGGIFGLQGSIVLSMGSTRPTQARSDWRGRLGLRTGGRFRRGLALTVTAISLQLLTMCRYGYDLSPLSLEGAAGAGAISSFAGTPQGGSVGSGGAPGQAGGAGGMIAAGGSLGASGSGGVSGGAGGSSNLGGTANGGMAPAVGGTAGATTGGVSNGGSGGVTSGLVGYWKLDEVDTNCVVLDSSAIGNHGTYGAPAPLVSSATPPAVQFANPSCLEFNGGDQQVSISYIPTCAWTNTSSFTLTAWAYVPALGGQHHAVLAHEVASNPVGVFDYCGIWLTPANEWSFEPMTTKRGVTSPATVGWHHVAAVQDGAANIRRLYVDGVLSAKTEPAVFCNNTAPYHTGASDDGNSDFWDGRIDEVRMYNRALSQAEVANLSAGMP